MQAVGIEFGDVVVGDLAFGTLMGGLVGSRARAERERDVGSLAVPRHIVVPHHDKLNNG